jgi:MoaA/NifB/PqqE/SkfB family radical SAM enzyme
MAALQLNRVPIDVMVTNRCNLHCRKCYAPKAGPEGTLAEFCNTLDKLFEAGIRRIVLTGGEPLVRDDVVEIARYASDLGFDVSLSTNSILLRRRWSAISPYLSWVGISLDSPTPKLNRVLVGNGARSHFESVLEFLRHRRDTRQARARVKLGTVVTRRNKDHLLELGRVIFREQPGYVPDAWRLYQYSASGHTSGDDSRDLEFAITERELEDVVDGATAAFPDVSVSYATAAERDEAYIFIRAGLDLAYPRQGAYVQLGDTRRMSAAEIRGVLCSFERVARRAIQNRRVYEVDAVPA